MMLRDHDRPCEHERGRTQGTDGLWGCFTQRCRGGAPIEVDYEAAEAVLRADHELAPYRGRLAVNAALGIVEVDNE